MKKKRSKPKRQGGIKPAYGSMGGMNYESTSHKEITKELTYDLSHQYCDPVEIVYRIYRCITTSYAFFVCLHRACEAAGIRAPLLICCAP